MACAPFDRKAENMISAVFCFVLSNICAAALPQQNLPDVKNDWLYIGKGVRVIHFEVNSDVPSNKDIFNLNHKSGYLVLDEERFSVSVASMLGTSLALYKNGALERTEDSVLSNASDAKKKVSVKLDYLTALTTSLNDSVDQRFGELVRDLLSKDSRQPAPISLVDHKPFGLTRICEFNGSWWALKRVEWFSSGTGVRTVCKFKVVLPKL